jgi:hypothetical protein
METNRPSNRPSFTFTRQHYVENGTICNQNSWIISRMLLKPMARKPKLSFNEALNKDSRSSAFWFYGCGEKNMF